MTRVSGWSARPGGGWGRLVLVMGVGLAGLVLGAALLLGPGLGEGDRAAVVAGTLAAAVGLACLAAVPAFHPDGQRHVPRTRRVQVDGEEQQGVAFPYSRVRLLAPGCAVLTAAMASGVVLFGWESLTGRPLTGQGALVSGAVMLTLGAGAVVQLRSLHRRPGVVATPDALVVTLFGSRRVVRWRVVDRVVVGEELGSANGTTVRRPYVELRLLTPQDVSAHGLVRVWRALGIDEREHLRLPVQPLACPPELFARALRFYGGAYWLQDELGDDRALSRLERGDLSLGRVRHPDEPRRRTPRLP